MDIAYIYSFGMFVKVVGYQTDRVGAGGGYETEHPAAAHVATDFYHVTGTLGDFFQGRVGLWRVMGMSRILHTCHVMDIRDCWRTRQL